MITFTFPSDEHVVALVCGLIVLLTVAGWLGVALGEQAKEKGWDKVHDGTLTMVALWLLATVIAAVAFLTSVGIIFFRGTGVS